MRTGHYTQTMKQGTLYQKLIKYCMVTNITIKNKLKICMKQATQKNLVFPTPLKCLEEIQYFKGNLDFLPFKSLKGLAPQSLAFCVAASPAASANSSSLFSLDCFSDPTIPTAPQNQCIHMGHLCPLWACECICKFLKHLFFLLLQHPHKQVMSTCPGDQGHPYDKAGPFPKFPFSTSSDYDPVRFKCINEIPLWLLIVVSTLTLNKGTDPQVLLLSHLLTYFIESNPWEFLL